MAEALGIVASGVAVMQLVTQVSSGILKLRALLEEIKNVSPMLAQIIAELDILIPVLTEIETIEEELPPGGSGDKMLKVSVQNCRRAGQRIADMATPLSREIAYTRRRKRLLASLKVVLAKDTLARLERELAAAIQLLMLAQQSYLVAIHRRDHHILVSMVAPIAQIQRPDCINGPRQAVEADHQRDSEEAPRQDRHERQGFTPTDKFQDVPRFWTLRCLGATVDLQWTTGAHHARIIWPQWASSLAWKLQVAKATSGWQMSIRSHPIRETDSKPFVYAREGNLNSLLECFNSGEASPFDQDIHGWSLIHHAAFDSNFDICKKLLDMGVNINERTSQQWTILRLVTMSLSRNSSNTARLDFMKYLMSRGTELERYESEPLDSQLGLSYHGPADGFLLMQSHFFPHYYDEPLQTRLRCALRIALPKYNRATEVGAAIRRDGEISEKDVAESTKYNLPILNLVLLGFSIQPRYSVSESEVPAWEGLIHGVLSRYRDRSDLVPLPTLDTSYCTAICCGQIKMATPLFCTIIGACRAAVFYSDDWQAIVASMVQRWAEIVLASGLNIEYYGRLEQAYFEDHYQHNWFHVTFLVKGEWMTTIFRLKHLRLNSEKNSWDLVWSDRLDVNTDSDNGVGRDYVAGLPGAWVEDELSHRQCSCYL